MSLKRRMDKENVVHLHNGVLLSNLINNIMKFASKWIELEKIIFRELIQNKEDKNGTYSLRYGYQSMIRKLQYRVRY